jgi:glycosyltransferase involved in cell wall biosynthesis
MNAYSGLDDQEKHPPLFLFAAVGLVKGSGGIAELSRQVFKTLLDMHRKELIRLEVHILEGSGPQADDELFKDDNLPAIRWYSAKRWKFALSLIASRSDVQLLDHAGLARLPGLIPRPLGRHYILLIHGVELWNSNRTDYLRAARKATFLIANSEYTAQKARTRYPDLPEIRVCWPGKDEPDAASINNDKAMENIGPHAMLIVGRLSAEQKHKGHDHLLEAMQLIMQAVPDAQLVIVGEGDDQERLETIARELNMADKVIFTGWVSEARLHRLYSQCALFVMPSEGDGFGIVFLEAMMHRLPCVGLQNGAAAEIFQDEESGILIDREDRRGMANRLSSLLLDETRRERLGASAYDRYQDLFQGKHHSARLQSILMDHLGAQ